MSKKVTFADAVTAKLADLRDGNTYSTGKLTKEAGLIGTAAAKMDVRYHAAAVAALGCVRDHNDTSGMRAVLNNVGRAVRAKALAEWLEKYSHVVCTLDKKTKAWTVKLLDAEDRYDYEGLNDLMVAALDDPFWTPEEKSARDFSLHAALAALLKKAENPKAKETMNDNDKEALVKLQAIAEAVKPAAVAA